MSNALAPATNSLPAPLVPERFANPLRQIQGVFAQPAVRRAGPMALMVGLLGGAALVGAKRIIAVDMDNRKLEWARQFGATHTILGGLVIWMVIVTAALFLPEEGLIPFLLLGFVPVNGFGRRDWFLTRSNNLLEPEMQKMLCTYACRLQAKRFQSAPALH